ncbi:MAG: sensor histidine kinase [Myxococcaceae bacterium]|nr:sensor histidine kinase [Myxococcaceae bacterium]
MDSQAALHRQIRGPAATAALVAIIFGFAVAPLFPVDQRVLGYDAWLSLPLGVVGAAWTLSTGLVFRRQGLGSPLYAAMNRGETVLFSTICLAAICQSQNPASAVWVLHFGHVVTCGTSGGERRYNLTVFTVASALATGYFALVRGPAAAGLVAAIAGVAIYAYAVMSGTASKLSEIIAQRDRLQAELTAVTVSQERARIARDLHDGVGAELSSLFWQLQSLAATATTPEARASFDGLTQRITQSTDELRNVVWELRATSLAWPELIAHLRTRCAELAGDVATVTLEASGDEAREIAGDVRMNVARIVQEAVRNAIHHGRARHLAIRLHLGERLVVEVDDDGSGIAPDAARRSVGGLRNIDVRVKALGGTFTVSPREGGGTRLRAEIPLALMPSSSSVTG